MPDSAVAEPLPRASVSAGPRRLSFTAGVTWTFAANVVYALSQWCMLSVLTKISSPETAGRFILALAVSAPVVLLANCQLRYVQAADPLRTRGFDVYFTLRMTTAAVAFATVILICILGEWPQAAAGVTVAVAAFKVIESFSDVTYGLFQQTGRMDYIGTSLMIRGPVAAALLGAVFLATASLTWACLAVAVAWLAVFCLYDRRKAQELAGNSHSWLHWHWREMLSVARAGAPLGAVAMLWTLNTNIPRYLVEQQYGERALGIFGAVAYLHVAGVTFAGALGQAAIPHLAAGFRSRDDVAFRRVLTGALMTAGGMGLTGILVALLFGRRLLTVLYTPEFGEYAGLLILQMVASCCAYLVSVLECALNSVGCFDGQLPSVLATTLVTAISVFAALPAFGLSAIPLSMTGSYLLHGTVSAWLLGRAFARRDICK